MTTAGTSFGKVMTWEQHVENYPDKEELKVFKRLIEISKIMQSGKTTEGISLMETEFSSVEEAIELFEAVKKKIFKGWIPSILN